MQRKLQHFKSKVVRVNSLPKWGAKFSSSALLFDQRLIEFPEIAAWVQNFPISIPLPAGENLKTLDMFAQIADQLIASSQSLSINQFIVLGGGSVGDFAGFLASVWKRGKPLIQIPSTWLSAMDSAHGGKTALNLGPFKNQIGTFWPAQEVLLVKDLLLYQPKERTDDAVGEAIKMALLMGGSLWRDVKAIQSFDSKTLWTLLPRLVDAKYKVVMKDPYETKELRQILNLGHTLGHVWEISHQVPHGKAVAAGVRVAIEISRKQKWMSAKHYSQISTTQAFKSLPSLEIIRQWTPDKESLKGLLAQDKKRKGNTVNYIGLERPGKPVVKPVSIEWLSQASFQVIHGQ